MGTHVLENKIGTIRSLSFQDESAMNLIQTAARHDFIKTLSKSNDEIKRTRLNQGGVRLNLGKEDIDFGADNCLYHGTEKQLPQIFPYIPVPNITAYVNKRRTELSNRPLTISELFIYKFLASKKTKLKDIAAMLPCRTAQSLKKLLGL